VAQDATRSHRGEMRAADLLAPIIRELRHNGYSIAGEFEKRRVEKPRGGTWHPQLVIVHVELFDGRRPGLSLIIRCIGVARAASGARIHFSLPC
jgi:hypothetical protein